MEFAFVFEFVGRLVSGGWMWLELVFCGLLNCLLGLCVLYFGSFGFGVLVLLWFVVLIVLLKLCVVVLTVFPDFVVWVLLDFCLALCFV